MKIVKLGVQMRDMIDNSIIWMTVNLPDKEAISNQQLRSDWTDMTIAVGNSRGFEAVIDENGGTPCVIAEIDSTGDDTLDAREFKRKAAEAGFPVD